MSDIDLSRPLSAVLRDGTKKTHDEIAQLPSTSMLVKGQLDKLEYIRFLMMLWHIYTTLELALERHASHPVLSPTYNPSLFARAPSLASDIAFLLDVPESSWQSHPLHVSLCSPLPGPLAEYVDRLRHLSDAADDPSPLLAHAYVRYLGDLSGGQVVRRNIAKAYSLEEDGSGVQFYVFRELGGSNPATIDHMNKIKDWFRAGMDAAAGDNTPLKGEEKLKAALLEEVGIAFKLNKGILSLIRPPGTSPLGKRMQTDAAELTFPLSTVIAVLLAASLAHFFLVVSGLTGTRGYWKLQALQQWIWEFFEPSKLH